MDAPEPPGPAPHAARRVVHIASRALDVGSLVAPRCQRGGPRPDGREITASGDVQNVDDAVFFADFPLSRVLGLRKTHPPTRSSLFPYIRFGCILTRLATFHFFCLLWGELTFLGIGGRVTRRGEAAQMKGHAFGQRISIPRMRAARCRDGIASPQRRLPCAAVSSAVRRPPRAASLRRQNESTRIARRGKLHLNA